MIWQLEVDQVKLAEIAHDRLRPFSKGYVHHEDDQLGDFLLDTIEHLLNHLNRLVRQELSFVLLLVLESAAPHEQPAHEDVRALAFRVELGAQLVALG